MKKRIAALIFALFVAFPEPSYAGLDLLSVIEDILNSFQEKMNLVVKQYNAIESSLQELTVDFDAVNSLRKQVETELITRSKDFYNDSEGKPWEFLHLKAPTVTLSGIPQIDASGQIEASWPGLDLGAMVTPQLQAQISEVYMKRKHVLNDVQAAVYSDLRLNNLQVENVSTLYASGLVHQEHLMEEEVNLTNSVNEDGTPENDDRFKNTDVELLIAQYGRVTREAHHRWLDIMEFEASYKKMLHESEVGKAMVDDVSDVTGLPESSEQKEDMQKSHQVETNILGEGYKKVSPTEKLRERIEAIKKSDYAKILGVSSDSKTSVTENKNSFDETMKQISSAVEKGQNIANNIQNNDWKSTISDAASQAADNLTKSGYEGYGGLLNNTNDGVNALLNGDFSGAVDASAGIYSVTHADETEVSGFIKDSNSVIDAALKGDWEGAQTATKNNRQQTETASQTGTAPQTEENKSQEGNK